MNIVLFEPFHSKHKEVFRFVAYFFNASFLSYVTISFVRSYQKNLEVLREQNQFNQNLYSVFDNTDDFIGIAAPKSGQVFHNRAFVEATGIDPKATDFELSDFHPEHIVNDVLRNGFETAKREGVWTGESEIKDKEGNIIPVIQTLITHYDESTQSHRTSTIMKDISALKEAIDERYKLTKLLLRTEANAKVGSWSLDLKTGELWWSDQTYIIHEVPIGSELVVDEAINFYHPDDRDKVRAYVESAVQHGKPYSDELRLITASGKQIWAHVTGRKYSGPDGEKLEGSFQDITMQKQSEQAKSAFLSLVSHEMRTPLMAIIGFSDVMSEAELSPELKGYVKNIQESSHSLLALINDVLDNAKYSAKGLSLKKAPANLHTLMNEIEAASNQLNRSPGVEIVFNYDVKNEVVFTDGYKLKQIINNLLSNSIKFTEKGEVRVALKEYEPYKYRINVSDTGVGMSEEFLPRLFDDFEQDFDSKKSHQGTGLGMSITKKLVKLFKGHIEVTSKLGEGTSFELLLELEPSTMDLTDSTTTFEIKETTKSCHVVYTDDNQLNRQVVKSMLKKSNINLTLLEDGQQLVDYYKDNQDVDLILVDIQMPVMNGLDATKAIREFAKKSSLAPVPIIAFSAYTYDEDREKAINAGCNDTLDKPVKKDKLLNKIEYWLNEEDKKAV